MRCGYDIRNIIPAGTGTGRGGVPAHLLNLNIQIHLLLDIGISGRQHLNFGVGQCRFVNVVGATDR